MASTLAQLRDKVRQRADMETSQFIKDAELTSYINNSYAELYDLLVSRFEDYYIKSLAFSIATGNTYAVPADFYKLRGVDLKIDSGIDSPWTTVFPFNFTERNRIESKTRNILGRMTVSYRLAGQNIMIYPEDRAPNDYRMWYIPRYTPLSADSDQLSDVMDFEEYIIVDAAIKCLVKEESDPQALMILKAALKQRIEEMASNRDAGSPQVIADVNSGNSRFQGTSPYWGW